MQWLRKAVLRAAGLKALHDEEAAFAAETEAARGGGRPRAERLDGYSFAIAFKGVLLEGLEVAFIVLTFGANQHRVGLAAAGGAASPSRSSCSPGSPRARRSRACPRTR